MCLLGRGLHTLIKNASFSSPTDVKSHIWGFENERARREQLVYGYFSLKASIATNTKPELVLQRILLKNQQTY